MSEDKWKVIKIKFEQTLKSWELDKKTNQFTTDSICSLFPTEIEAIIKYIEDLENNWNELKKFNEEKLKQYRKQLAQATTDLEDEINYTRCYCYRENLDKMQELEGNNE